MMGIKCYSIVKALWKSLSVLLQCTIEELTFAPLFGTRIGTEPFVVDFSSVEFWFRY